jgi:hypothetical protein
MMRAYIYISGVSNKYQFYSLCFDSIGLKPTIYSPRGEHANHYTIDAVGPAKQRQLDSTSDK